MTDVLVHPEAPAAPEHVAIFRKDYRPPDWLVPEVRLEFELDPDRTKVRSRLKLVRNGDHNRAIRLAGEGLEPLAVRVDGAEAPWSLDSGTLVIELEGDDATVETEIEISPAANNKLMGLYSSGGLLCTQCESEGFRRITFHPDRPDVLSRYSVRMSADKTRFPILLANGNLIGSGDGEVGRHWAKWEDPFPKPSYLFAMVAGDLAANSDRFTTMSGREVALNIWVRTRDLPKTAHAMDSLKAAMRWDEDVYGREYDLDLFNIVAVDDFNFGAMENKGLNIFNSRYVLADQDTATDVDFDNIAGVVAHEYFHNWSGDRVTCRDWFQLSLKEGFTVFRDQGFSADMGSAAVKRIEDVRLLRAAQFPEDAGPLAHPVRPESYIEITNFYTATVYNKGAEVIRMMRTILGEEAFRKGSDLYFDRHDGQAVTCEDFVKAMEDASGVDLSQFRLWYSQAGTPQVAAKLDYDPTSASATLKLRQRIPNTPGQADKQPMVIPLNVALIGKDSGATVGEERLILLNDDEESISFFGIDESPLLSINRDFSAPVMLAVERQDGDLEKLAEIDANPFARYEACQELMYRSLIEGTRSGPADPSAVVAAIRGTLRSNELDPAFKGEALLLPSEGLIGDRMDLVDPDAIHRSRESLRTAIGSELASELAQAQSAIAAGDDLSASAKGVRKLKTVALWLLAGGDRDRGLAMAKAQYDRADNMTDRQGALSVLTSLEGPEREAAFADFYQRYKNDSLVLDKWFALQAAAQRTDTIDVVEALARHEDFGIRNPNRWRALVGNFAANQWAFHHPSGRGYRFVADMILEVDRMNPQVAARQVPSLGRWRRFESGRAGLMRAELDRIVATPGISRDVYEQASKSLG
ncbi:aminopeptidase N [Sphingomonas sp. NSE70-1]|uniref:Aminopeptidase N n=1 Tax=Sphingomonas caseinilyticus TaxID=2908205 RepID=A0ABT0RVR3_9SPHN|nr:aminopeptidase N [Sphingomonas caseinilyticus]MCL6699125.1 aminopeptidase N [Sphingomonas caseinilyticus]